MFHKFLKTAITVSALLVPHMAASAIDYKLNRFTVTPDKWNTNSYWLESAEGIVLIDGQLLIEDAELWAVLLKSRNKPIKGAIITHAHPDHFGGLNTLRKKLGYFPVITTKGTADTFETMREQALQFTKSMFGDQYDEVQIKPDQIIDGNGEIELAGITFKIEDIGPGESPNATLIYEPDQNILFSGDATMHHGHVFTGEGRSEDFLRQLNLIKTKYKDVSFIYAGHGDPARVSHVDKQIAYIKDIQAVAKKAIIAGDYMAEGGQRFSREAIERYASEITEKYPGLSDYGFPAVQIVGGNIAGVIRELNRRKEVAGLSHSGD